MQSQENMERWMSSDAVINFPCRLEDLPTPALIVDEDVVRRNCERMVAKAAKAGVTLRPHVKVSYAWMGFAHPFDRTLNCGYNREFLHHTGEFIHYYRTYLD
jgi:hypothetical protein